MNMIPPAPAAPATPAAPASASGTKAGVDVASAFAALVEALSGEFLAAEHVTGEHAAADGEAAPGDQAEEADAELAGDVAAAALVPAPAPVALTQVPASPPVAPNPAPAVFAAAPEPDAATALTVANGGAVVPGPDATSDAGTSTVAAPAVVADAADDGAPAVPLPDAPRSEAAPAPAGTVEQEAQTPDDGSQHPDGNRQPDASEPVVARPAPPVAPPTDAPRDGAAPLAAAASTSATVAVEAPSNVAAPARSEAPALPDQLVRVLTPLRKGPDGTHRVAIQLRPDDLGEVQVDVRVRGNEIALTLRADLAGTTDLLRSTLSELRAELEAAGFRAGDLDVADHQAHGGPGREVDDPTRGRNRSNRPAAEVLPDRTADPTPGAPPTPVRDTGANNLDLRL